MNCENYFRNNDKSISFVGNISFSNFNQVSTLSDQNEDESKFNFIEDSSSNKKTKETYFSSYKDFHCEETENVKSIVCVKCHTEIYDCLCFCVNCEYIIHQRCLEKGIECYDCKVPLSTVILEKDSTLESSGILKLVNTNINNIENYQEFHDLSNKLDKKNYVSFLSDSLMKMKVESNSNKKMNLENFRRTALSPICLTTPYSGKRKVNFKDITNLKKSQENVTPINMNYFEDEIYYDRSPHISEIKQQLFVSPLRNIDIQEINEQLNNSFVNNNNNGNENDMNYIYQDKDDFFECDQSRRFFTTTFANNRIKKRYDDSYSKENFFKCLNFESNNILFDNLQFKHNFKSLDIDFENYFNDQINESPDKENIPSIPRESSKFSMADNSPIEFNMQTGVSYISTNETKVHEVPIVIDIKLKDNFMVNYSKDYVLVFNSKSIRTII